MLILASNSPRRRQLLALLGLEFAVQPVDIDEQPFSDELPDAYVMRLAQEKARAAAKSARPDALILAADTTVADGNSILGKPADEQEAAQMLRQLRGRSHRVYTALALLHNQDGQLLVDCCRTDVPMRGYTEDEIDAYIATGDPMDKAGAYAIQHKGFHPVETLKGCYANVVGLPLCHLLRTLRKLGLEPHSDVPAACQAMLQYDCPVFTQVLTSRSMEYENRI